MDADRFDDIARWLTAAAARRDIARALGGLGAAGLLGSLSDLANAEARKKKRKKGKKKKKPQGCRTACCANTDCGTGRICAQGQCVTGQGMCATGVDACESVNPACGAPACYCSTRDGQTRCGHHSRVTACNSCVNDADCAALLPDTPGAFCTTGSADRCECRNFCRVPCAS